MDYDRRQAASPKPYNIGDYVEIRAQGYPQKIRVEEKIQIKGKPGFVGRDEHDGAQVTGLDEQIVRVTKPTIRESPISHEAEYFEILMNRIQGTTVQDEATKFLRLVIARGQKVANLVEDSRKQFEQDYKVNVDMAKLEKTIFKNVVYPVFGDDPLAKALARAIARGDYLF